MDEFFEDLVYQARDRLDSGETIAELVTWLVSCNCSRGMLKWIIAQAELQQGLDKARGEGRALARELGIR